MRILQLTCLLLISVITRAQDKTLYLNPDNALGAKASTLFESADILQLQTSKESYIGNIEQFLVTPGNYIFLDNAGKTIFVFDKEGKFLFKYKKKKYKIEQIQYIYSKNAIFIVSKNKNYTIPQAKTQQMIQQAKHRDFAKYVNLDLLYLDKGVLTKPEKLNVPAYALNDIYFFNGDYLVDNGRYNKYLKDSVAYHLLIIQGNKIITSYFPYINLPKLPPYYQDIGFTIRPLNDTAFLIQKDFDNTIYKLSADSLAIQYKFVFPAALTMPSDFQSTMFKNNIEFTNYKNKNIKAISGFGNLLQHQNFLFFSAADNSYSSKTFLFNDLNNNLYDLGKVITDSSIYFIPSRIFTSINEQDAEYVYAQMSNMDLLKEKAAMLSKNKELPVNIKTVLDGLNKFNNPVIIKFKTKAVTTK